MEFRLIVLLVVALGASGCGSSSSEEDTAAGGVVADTALLREAKTAANDIVRNATDCDYIARQAPEVYRLLDQASGEAQTQAGRQSVDTLRRQVERVTEPCGVR